ncbi:MAG: glycosyltransferase family 4 protein [Methanosarcinales archaeon]|nr:glycosyltransferase family 4 protein [Methanosarcinales archaeon]
MKILMITHRFPPSFGGIEHHTYLFSKELAKKGYDVTIYTTNSLTNEDVLSLPFLNRRVQKPNLPKKSKIDNIIVNRFDITIRYWSFNYIPELFKSLRNNSHEFDIIHAHGYSNLSSLVGCYYANKYNRPFILTSHDMEIADNFPLDAKIFKKIYDRNIGRYLIKKSEKLIALTEDQIQQYIDRGGDPNKIKIIPNGIELSKYVKKEPDRNILSKFGIQDEDRLLLFVGRIEKYKGIQDLIEFINKIERMEDRPNVKLIIIGEDAGYKGELEKLARKLRVDDKIIFAQTVSEKEKIELFYRADIFPFPSKMEGFGIVLLEAMATNTLCIGYSIPAIKKIINNKENGILVDNKSEFFDKILYFLKNKDAKSKIEKVALDEIGKYDIKNVVEKLLDLYAKVY